MFSDYLIAIIVITSVLFLASIPGGYIFYKKWRNKPPESETLIRPEQLQAKLTEWDENQNSGCEKEWNV